MAHWKPVDDILAAANVAQDLVNKLGGEERIKRVQSGDLVLVERSSLVVASDSSENGGISPYVSNILNPEAFIADWREFYRQVHGMKTDPSGLVKRLPPVTPGFNWGAWVLKGTTPQRAYEMGASMYPSWKWCGDRSLNEVIDFTKEVRTAQKRQYIAWCKDRVEADHELKNTSALQIGERQINTITLTEVELLHQWFYWKSGGKHLDTNNWTLCPASRFSDGVVPSVYWGGDFSWLYVFGFNPDGRGGVLRSREAVS